MSRHGSDGLRRWDSGLFSWQRRRSLWGWREISHKSNWTKKKGGGWGAKMEGMEGAYGGRLFLDDLIIRDKTNGYCGLYDSSV